MLTPVSWLVEGSKNTNGSYIVIIALVDSNLIIYGYVAKLTQEWPLGNLYLAFNNEDYFWFGEINQRDLQPHIFQNKEEAELAALNA